MPAGAAGRPGSLKKLSATALNISPQKITGVQVLKRSIDARGRRVVYRMQIKVYVDETYHPETYTQQYPNIKDAKPVIIVGAGPAGLFAARKEGKTEELF